MFNFLYTPTSIISRLDKNDNSNGSYRSIVLYAKRRKCWYPAFHLFYNRRTALPKTIPPLKVALQILGRKFYINTKISSLYSQSLLIFIHKTPVVENHLTTIEIRELLRPKFDTEGNHGLFLHE